jgi:hypothetical protein
VWLEGLGGFRSRKIKAESKGQISETIPGTNYLQML